MTTTADDLVLRTSVGESALHEYRLRLGDREWSLLHTGAILTHADEARYLDAGDDRRPYAVVLWPAAIALAHDLAARGDALRSATVLELGAGTGLPGIVAATLGARVTQTDRQEVALAVSRRNAVRNGVNDIRTRQLEWSDASTEERYDYIIGADIAYARSAHEALLRLFATHVADGGRVLLADPFREASLPLLEALERDGWTVSLSKWTIDVDGEARAIGIYELAAPARASSPASSGA